MTTQTVFGKTLLPEYPRPPLPAQQQEWPGLQSLMKPRPDSGEARRGLTPAPKRASFIGSLSGAYLHARSKANISIHVLKPRPELLIPMPNIRLEA
jgi:hypothetical protein